MFDSTHGICLLILMRDIWLYSQDMFDNTHNTHAVCLLIPVGLFANTNVVCLLIPVRYHSGGSMKLNACILLLAHIVYL